jgi:dsDNA-specific endonuclease/ATPase MutS2
MHRNNQRADAKLVTDELHLRRLTVDEALPKLDKYLNDAFVAGLYQGYGNSR